MKYLLLLLSTILSFLQITAQQWAGPNNTTGTIYRSGKIGIGSSNPQGLVSISTNYTTTAQGNFSELTLDNNGSTNFYGSSLRNIYTRNNPNFLNPRLAFLVQKTDTDKYQDLMERMTILGNGNVGIGTSDPAALLDVRGSFKLGVDANIGGRVYSIGFSRVGSAQLYGEAAGGLLLGGDGTGYDMAILPNGNVGIATGNPTQKLHVNGTTLTNKLYIGSITDAKASTNLLAVAGSAIFEKVSVKLYGVWPDYVFQPEYNLMSLKEVERFIDKNKHLPNIPSAEEMQASEGMDLGEMNLKLLEKVEELTLHLIEMQKKIEKLDEELSHLRNNE